MTSTAVATGKLGKRPVKTDVRTLSFARYVDLDRLPQPPALLDLTEHVPAWPMYANDRTGDCTIAAAGHMIEAWTAAAKGEAVEVSEQSVLRAFEQVKIVDPETGEEGAIELDVLNWWRRHGISRHRIGAFARVSVHEHDLVRAAAWLFGGVYIGLQLPVSARGRTTWDWNGSLTDDDAPGSWGGHAVDVVRYSPGSLTVVTWGRLQDMTWSFWDRYCDEAYAVLSRDFLDRGTAPNGFDLEALRADLALITA
jgi:hypothetical protein